MYICIPHIFTEIPATCHDHMHSHTSCIILVIHVHQKINDKLPIFIIHKHLPSTYKL